MEYTSPWVGFKLTTLMVICTDCIGSSSNSNYHTITNTTSSRLVYEFYWYITHACHYEEGLPLPCLISSLSMIDDWVNLSPLFNQLLLTRDWLPGMKPGYLPCLISCYSLNMIDYQVWNQVISLRLASSGVGVTK